MDMLGPKKSPKMAQNGNFISQENTCPLEKIVDVTIAYPQGKPLDLLQIITGWRMPCITHVHYRVFDISEVILGSPQHY